jgi:hypothetical protein
MGVKRPSRGGKAVSFGPLKRAMNQMTKQMRTAVKANPKAEPRVSKILTKYEDLLAEIKCDKVMTIKF